MQRGTYYWIILLSALVFITLVGAVEPGDYTVDWNRTYGGAASGEAAYAIMADPGGAGFFIAGETGAFGAGEMDAWVVRLTPEGDEVWNNTYGAEEAGTARAIIPTDDGSILIAGTLTFVTDGVRPDTDAWIAKIDPSGREIWNRTYGGPDVNTSANAVIGIDDGGYILFGSITPRGEAMSRALVIRLDESGEEVWNRTFGDAENSTANAAAQLPCGDLVFAGGTDSPSGAGMMDVWVVRLNESGDEVWSRTFGSPYDDCARAVIATGDGNILVAGEFTESSGDDTADTDALLMKLTPDGDIIWNWIYGDVGVNESASAVIERPDGGYIFAGETGFPGVDDTDAWLVGTDAGGAVAWSRIYGGINPGDRAVSVLQPAEDTLLFAGMFNATARGGPVNTDAWVVRLELLPEPAPEPTAAPIKPPKAPAICKKPVVTVTPTPCPTATQKPTEKPTMTDAPEPTMTERPEPTMTERPKPTMTERPEPTMTDAPKPTMTDAPKPTMTERPKPTMTERPKPTMTERPKPTMTERPKPTMTERPEPTMTERPEPTMTERPEPTMTDAPEPTLTDVPEPADHEDGANGSLSGVVWYDLNANGSHDPGEPGIPGICVRLIGRRTMYNHTVTDSGGSYRFSSLPPDLAGVEFLVPDGYSCTIFGPGSDAGPLTDSVAFAEGEASRQTLNAGFIGEHRAETPVAAYGWVLGTTWSDDNQDGFRDELYGMTGVEVHLLDAGGALAASARTGHHDTYTSMYLFGPLLPGEYSLVFTAPEDYIFTDPGGDSHADPLTGTTEPFRVGGGDTIVRDAGLIPSPITENMDDGTGVEGGESGIAYEEWE
ncbi:MAG: hypothetical protein GX882_06515, partial [Methanomicrobiales archaeon]|nr:hypothetical protein [Methanomicrobiales archaeon]